MSILISNANGGLETTVATLEAARTGASYANKTITVTSSLTQAQSNISGAWPADRGLRIEQGGSIANSTAFTFTDGKVFSAWQGYIFKGAGAITGLITARPEYWAVNTTPGTTDMASALQSAANAVEAKQGTVILGPTIYAGSYSSHPDNSSYKQILYIGSGVTLRGSGIGVTTILLLPNQPNGAMLRNRHIATIADSKMVVEDIIFDGNSANQPHVAGTANAGIAWLRVVGVLHNRLLIKNVMGTADNGAGEGFHFEAGLSSDLNYTDCVAFADYAYTSSGFSVNASTNIIYVNCSAVGMKIGNGFTHNGCAHVIHTNCRSYLNYHIEFNSEASHDVTYVNSHAGGTSTDGLSGSYTDRQNLGIAPYGFVANGGDHVVYSGVSSREPSGVGIYINATSGNVTLTGSDVSGSAVGISIDPAAAVTSSISNVNTTDCITEITIPAGVGNSGYNRGKLTQPAMPLTTVALVNPYPFTVSVTVIGAVDNVTWMDNVRYAPATESTYSLPPGQSISVAYSGAAPAWLWQVL